MKSRLTFLAIGFVSIFGLTSCSENSAAPASETSTVDTSWRLPKPRLDFHKGGKLISVEYERILTNAVAADATLVFPENQKALLDGAQIEANSICSLDSKRYEKAASYTAESKIRLSDLFPAEALPRLDVAALKNLECDFQFEARRNPGDPAHKFELRNVHFDDFSAFETLVITHKEANSEVKPASELNVAAVENFEAATLFPQDPSKVSLVCERGRSEAPKAFGTEITADLLQALTKDLAAHSDVGLTHQTCRIFSVAELEHHRMRVEFSKTFVVRFPLAPAKVQWGFGRDPYSGRTINNTILMWVEVQNPNDSAINLSLTNPDEGRQLQFQIIVSDDGNLRSLVAWRQALHTGIASQNPPTVVAGTYRIVVNPGEKIRAEFRIQSPPVCEALPAEKIAGLTYSFDNPIYLVQQDPDQHTDLTRWPNPTGPPHPLFDGWLAHESWIHLTGSDAHGVILPATQDYCSVPSPYSNN